MISAKLIPTKSIQTYAHLHKYMSNSGSPIEASLKPQVGCEMLVGRPRCRPSEVPPPHRSIHEHHHPHRSVAEQTSYAEKSYIVLAGIFSLSHHSKGRRFRAFHSGGPVSQIPFSALLKPAP